MELSDWFKGSEKGIARLSSEQREAFFSECGNNCVKSDVSTPLLCECSKQSILYVLRSLWKDKTFRVTICESILRGNQHCVMQIEAKDHGNT